MIHTTSNNKYSHLIPHPILLSAYLVTNPIEIHQTVTGAWDIPRRHALIYPVKKQSQVTLLIHHYPYHMTNL